MLNDIRIALRTLPRMPGFALAFIPVAVVAMGFQRVNWHLSPRAWSLSVLTGALISTGTLTLFAAYRTGKASVVTALTALYPALTVVLAVPLFAREDLTPAEGEAFLTSAMRARPRLRCGFATSGRHSP